MNLEYWLNVYLTGFLIAFIVLFIDIVFITKKDFRKFWRGAIILSLGSWITSVLFIFTWFDKGGK